MSEILPDNTIELNQEIKEITIYSNEIIGNFVSYNDPRLIDSRNPLAHKSSHSIGGTDELSPQDIGAQPAGDYIYSDDYRLYDERTPLPHKIIHSIGGIDVITPEDIGAQPAGSYLLPPVVFSDLSDDSNELLNVTKRLAKAWVNFNGTGSVSIRSAFNISSIADNGIGDYTINFIEPFSNTNYTFVTWSRDWNTDNFIYHGLSARSNTIKTISSIRLINNNMNNAFNYDSSECNIIFFGN